MTKPLLALSLVALAVACTQTPPPPVTPPPNPSAIARLEVTPAALLLTQQGQQQTLSVKAFNSSGAEVTTTVTWVSSRPEQVSASASGVLEAKTGLGASQIVAEVAGIKSAPVLVSVAQPAAGVVLIADAQVRGTATLVDPNAEADSDNPYEVLLTGITPPAVGSLLLGREGKAIGGEVISSVQEGDAVRVRLKLVPITTLMQTAQIKETLDYTNLQPSFPLELTQGYDIALKDGEYIFTPKPASSTRMTPQAIKEFKLGPYKCDFATPELPVALGQPGQFSLKFNPTLEIDFDRDAGLKKLIARADLSAKLKASLVLSAGGILNIDCAAPLYTKLLPLPGWAGLILAGELKAGLGFEIEGSLSIPLLGVELSSETKGTLEIGLDCTAGECKLVRNFNPINTNSVRFITPSIADIRTELFIYGYAFAKLKAGATLLEKLRMDVVTARAGLKLEGSFAPPSTQLEPNNNALEPDYQSSYKLGLLAEVVAGSINKAGDSAFRKLLLKLGIFKFNLLKFQTAKTLASSPKGAATLDKASFQAGNTVNFNVKLDPATTNFPFVGYNIERVLIMRKDGSSPAEVLATVTATPNQLEFSLPWVADADSTSPRGSAFYAFVDTALPVPFDLEMGRVGAGATAGDPDAVPYAGTIELDSIDTFEGADAQTRTRLVKTVRLHGEVQSTVGNSKLRLTRVQQLENLSDRNESYTIGGTIELCGYVASGTATEKSSSTDPDLTTSSIPFSASRTDFSFSNPIVQMKVQESYTITREEFKTYRGGTCSPEQLAPVIENKTGTYISNMSALDHIPILRGSIARDAQGNGLIVARVAETINIPQSWPLGATRTFQYTVALNLKQVRPAQDVDLGLNLIAPASAAPQGKLTYAVNLQNKSTVAATGIRAEFYLPAGFTVTDTQGWSGCVTIQTTVTCTAPSLAAGERRAFLIDVQAPASGGDYIVSARVSANETDPNSSDNFDTGATLILEP